MNYLSQNKAVVKRVCLLLLFIAAVLCTTKLTLEFGALTSTSTAAFSFLIIVLLSAFFGDMFIAIATSLVATLCFDYFYLPPVGTFNITAFSDWICLAAFLLASVLISRLTASAAENASKAALLDETLAHLKQYGEWIMGLSHDRLTLTGMAQEALRLFALEYCSIHVYGEGQWSHFSGAALSSAISQSIEGKLKDHPTDIMELADESLLGVQYVEINEGPARKALLVVKSPNLPDGAVGAIAYMIGLRLTELAAAPASRE